MALIIFLIVLQMVLFSPYFDWGKLERTLDVVYEMDLTQSQLKVPYYVEGKFIKFLEA